MSGLHKLKISSAAIVERCRSRIASYLLDFGPKHSYLFAFSIACFACVSFANPGFAQIVSWVETDVNQPGTAGSFSYNGSATPTPTYTTQGSGTGITYGQDSLGFTNVVTAGNVEIKGQLVSMSSTTSGAQAGLLIKDSYEYNGDCYAIAANYGGNINFYYRQRGGGLTTVSGPAMSAPVYLRLVRNGNTIAGFYSTDNETWTQVGSYTASSGSIMPAQFYIGMIASSNSTMTLNTVVFNYLSYATSLPQQSANLMLWLRSDVGCSASTWSDQSGNGNDMTQATGAFQPSITSGALNNAVYPSVTFNGSSQYMSASSGFSNLSAGASLFIVLNSTSSIATGDICAFGNASNSDAIFAQNVGTQASLSVYNSSSGSSVTTTGNPLNTSQYQLLEATFLPGASANTGVGTLYVNGSQVAQATNLVQNMNNTTRSDNLLGVGIGLNNYFQGSVAEVLFFSEPLSAGARASVESYVLSKYGVGNQPTLDAPTFSPGAGVYTPAQPVSISQDQNATCWFTTDGSTPSPGVTSQWFNTIPITLVANQVIKTLGVMPFFTNSSVSTGSYVLDPNSLPVPRSGLVLWLRPDYEMTTVSGKVSSWGDASGSGNTATQATSGNRPTFLSNAINGQPAVQFNSGSSTFLQLPGGMSDLSSGVSILAVVKPYSVSSGARLLDFGNGSASDNIYLSEPTSTGLTLETYNGSSGTSVTSSSAITLNQYQVVAAVDNGSGTATIYTNAFEGAQNASMGTLNNLLRADNNIGEASAGGNYFNGEIAELVVYSRALTVSELSDLQSYFMTKYQLLSNVPAPIISVAAGSLSAPTQVAIYSPAGASVFLTTDGSTPTTSSPSYQGPITVAYSQTVKAIAVINGVESSVASAAYTLDSTQWPAPGSTSTPVQLNLQLPGVAIPQDSNQH